MAKKKNKGFSVPQDERESYKLLVQEANRQIKRNLKYIDEEGITSVNALHYLVYDYGNPESWAGKKMVFSRSTKFESREDYEDYLELLERMKESKPAYKMEEYQDTIIDRLERTAIKYDVPLPNNRLPEELVESVKEMSLEQLYNWFDMGDPEEDIEVNQYASDDYFGVNSLEDFVAVTESRMGWLKKAYKKPNYNPKKKKRRK